MSCHEVFDSIPVHSSSERFVSFRFPLGLQ
jgi:hypothetical protein